MAQSESAFRYRTICLSVAGKMLFQVGRTYTHRQKILRGLPLILPDQKAQARERVELRVELDSHSLEVELSFWTPTFYS